MRRPGWLGAIALMTMNSACFCWGDDDNDTPPLVQRTPNQAPVVNINTPTWPPPGPDTVFTLNMTDDRGLRSASLRFANDVELSIDGTSRSVEIPAVDLGEGRGFLNIAVWDAEGARSESFVSGLLIDLTPPEITLGSTVVRHADDSAVELWVADAWILGRVELEIGGVLVEHQFDAGYPSTIGETWDSSLVKFDSMQFEEGQSSARVTLHDAAGNTATETFTLTLDGVPPVVTIGSPAPNAVVDGVFDVSLMATDEGGGPVWVELRVEGTPVADVVGPEATVQLDAADLTAGQVAIEAVAIDQAGNESVVASVPVIVQ